MWVVASTGEFDQWFATLEEHARIGVATKIELLEVFGPQLGRPHADTLNGSKHANMKELRADTGVAVLRVAFAFDPERSAILLIGGDKAGVNQKRFYKQLIRRADAIFDRHLEWIRKKPKEK